MKGETQMNTRLNFYRFANTSPQQRYTPLNPNYTGQAYHATPGTDLGTYTQDQDLSPEMKTFYDKNLIRLAEPEMVHDQFGQKRPIPRGNGKTIEFRKFNSLPAVPADRELLEGITPDGQNYGVTAITATVKQYGGYITLSDMLNLTAYDNQMQEVMKILASQAGRVSDTITRDILAAGTNVMYAGGRAARANLTSADVLTVEDIRKGVRILKRVNAKEISGSFVAIVHPDVVYDLMDDSEWIDANHYAGSQKIFEGEIGKMYGVRFVESTQAKIVKPSTLPIYCTLLLAENAYGVTSIEGRGIETIVKQLGSGGTADPLNQRSTVGYKLQKTAVILEQTYMLRIESAASFGASAEAN
jgi:N4-gp56 family major capsid protein